MIREEKKTFLDNLSENCKGAIMNSERVAYKKPVEVTAYTCPKCKQTVYSRADGDSHTCFCGSVACNGKLTKLAEQNKVTEFSTSKISIDASLENLSLDFYYNGGHFGTIQPKKD